MFQRLWWRSLTVKRPQALLALGALSLGAAVVALLLNLYSGVRQKMTAEFRAYGPNVVVSAAESSRTAAAVPSGTVTALDFSLLSEAAWGRARELQGQIPGLVAVPVLDVVARAAPGTSSAVDVVVVGTDLAALRQMNQTWRFAGVERADPHACILGARAAARLGLGIGDSIALQPENPRSTVEARSEFRVSSVVTSGASEDDQVFLPLASAQQLAGLAGKLSLVELNVPGERRDVERAVGQLRQTFAAAGVAVEVRAVPQVFASEAKVLDTIRSLLFSLTALILGGVALCVTATVTVLVLERRKDVALMKALGSSNRLVVSLLLSEISALGLVGGFIGFAVGALLARRLGQRLFGVTLGPAWWSLAAIAAASVLVTLLSTLVPVGRVRSIEPATMLKGE